MHNIDFPLSSQGEITKILYLPKFPWIDCELLAAALVVLVSMLPIWHWKKKFGIFSLSTRSERRISGQLKSSENFFASLTLNELIDLRRDEAFKNLMSTTEDKLKINFILWDLNFSNMPMLIKTFYLVAKFYGFHWNTYLWPLIEYTNKNRRQVGVVQ